MDLAKLNPWNWFKKEEEQDRNAAAGRAPVSRTQPQPANPLDALHGEIDRLFDNAFEGFAAPRLAGGRERHFRPKVDIAGDAKEYGIAVELPGVEEKDIRIELSGDELSISAERRREEKSEDKGFYRVERSYGSFRRVLTLPADADAAGVRAACRNGVVTITVPRLAAARTPGKRIPIA